MKQILAGAGALLLLGVPARADVVLSGPDSNAGTYSTAQIAALAATDGAVSSGGLTGVSMWNFLGGANATSPTSATYGAITTATPAGDNGKNAILRYYLTGTSASGQVSVVSLGEIDPNFGGTAPTPAFIAYETTGGGLLAAPELVVPGAPARTLTDLASLRLTSVAALASGGGGQSASVQLGGRVTSPGTYTAAALASQFTPVTETVAGDTYTGVPLNTFINSNDPNVTQQIVIARATDGYEVVYSLAELAPSIGGNGAAILPYADTGGNFPADGVARTILPGDNKQGRWVSNLASVSVEDVPEPASIWMLAIGLAVAACIRSRPVVRD